MKTLSQNRLEKLAKQFSGAPGLAEEILRKIERKQSEEVKEPAFDALTRIFAIPVVGAESTGAQEPAVSEERIVALSAGARPVARIRDNKVTTEFLGPDSEAWGNVIALNRSAINAAIPAVGRIELNNSDIPWAGTGWMISEGIIATNRHVADLFVEQGKLVFKRGFLAGSMSSDIDFIEEEGRSNSAEHPITSILWVAKRDEVDVAFLRVERAASGPELPKPIRLAEKNAAPGDLIGAIGYPARDSNIRDQRMVVGIFGDDVYEKKRFAPGKVISVEGVRLKHDCSTLGGNSGSVLLNLKTGEAVGIHHGGYLDDSANLAVTARHLRSLLDSVLKGETTTASPPIEEQGVGMIPHAPQPVHSALPTISGDRLELNFQVTVKGGSLPLEVTATASAKQLTASVANHCSVSATNLGHAVADPTSPIPGETPLAQAKRRYGRIPEVLNIRSGYRFKNGWITDEKVIVFEVREKMPESRLRAEGKLPLPDVIMGMGVDVRTAPLRDQLEDLGVGLMAEERLAKPAGYVEPSGYDDPESEFYLGRIRAKMDAVFHVSPDSGYKHLAEFIDRIVSRLTATIYEWDHDEISSALGAKLKGRGKKLRMVTQKNGVGGSDATESAVADMKRRIGCNFEHVWASVRGPDRLIPDSYHIKVASRDEEEVWLSSGNWKKSNHPIPTDASRSNALRKFNREWHVTIKNNRLAKLFQSYIDFDFTEATRVPLSEEIVSKMPAIEFFIPNSGVLTEERVSGVTYEDTLIITPDDGVLDIQPLLTPDRDEEGDRLFLKAATAMIKRARRKIYLQNQSFNFTAQNNAEFDQFFSVLQRKQGELEDVRIICRDARDYGRSDDLVKQQENLERLKDLGFNVSPDYLRLQSRCHTKGIIVDAKEVLIGSQNLTNGGALMNRDASLLVRSPKVAQFYEKIFLYDWDNLTTNQADETIGGMRRAMPGEETPIGFHRVTLIELLKGL
jgi:V8-like Glu-specific endopeptidase